ncbi:MjaI family restriction endonuclease [Euryarchaeota archaeon]|nr:MjaI family restriction endonuclease [Euryarchaeota archaeon]
MPIGVRQKDPENPGRLKFDEEMIINQIATATVQRPHAIGSLSEIVPNSGASSLEEWIESFLSGNHSVSLLKDFRNTMIQEMEQSGGDKKFRCACGWAGSRGNGVSAGSVDNHIKNEHQEEMSPEYLQRLIDYVWEKINKITREIVELFIYNVIFVRTWDGNVGEDKVVNWLEDQIKTRLAEKKKFKIKKTDARTDSADQVDYFIECVNGDIGLQVKPDKSKGYSTIAVADSDKKHARWQEKRGGKVFWPKYDGESPVRDGELLDEILSEMERLGGLKFREEEE